MDFAQVVFDKKARRYTVNLFGQTFVGLYQPSLKIQELLDTLYDAWSLQTVKRTDFCLLKEGNKAPIPEGTKLSKLLALKNPPNYVIGCSLNAVVSSPNLGEVKPFIWVFSLGDTMGTVAQSIVSLFGAEMASFFIAAEGTTVNLGDFIHPLASITLGEFLATTPNSLQLTSSQTLTPPAPEPEVAHEKQKEEEKKNSKPDQPRSKISVSDKDMSRKKSMVADMKRKEKGEAQEEMEEIAQPVVEDREFRAPSPPISHAPETLSQPRSPAPARSSSFAGPAPAPPEGGAAPSIEMNKARLSAPPPMSAEKDESSHPFVFMNEGAGASGTDDKSLLQAGTESPGAPVVPPTKYTVNMGMEYYSVMMEKTSYLFYIHLSQKELKIETEEGKVVYQTTFTFVAKKEEPPVLELKVYGEGFEVHPLSGKVTVMKEAINPPLIIFSVMPVPLEPKAEEGAESGKKKKPKKKGLDQRNLHVMVTYEGDTVNHTVLGVTVQPKHYQIKLGPITLNVSKPLAMLISVATSAVASYSVITGVMKTTASPSLTDAVANVAPGAASWVAIIMYFVALAKAIKPLKQTWASAFAAGKLPGMMK